jgi:superfamily II DNA or RNA helicase
MPPDIDAPLHHAAQRLIDSGAVSNVRVLQAGRVVTGLAGDRQRVYVQYAHVGAQAFDGECSCGAPSPCVHIAAVLLSAAKFMGAAAEARPQGASIVSPLAPALERGAFTGQTLCYFVEPASGGGASLSVWVKHSPEGGRPAATFQAFAPRAMEGGKDYPRYVDARDRSILDALTQSQFHGPWELTGSTGFDLIQRALATGRAYWRPSHRPEPPLQRPLHAAGARQPHFAWRVLPNGEQRLGCDLADRCDFILGLEPPVYVADTGECGAVELPYPHELLRRYWSGPALEPGRVPAVNASIDGDPRATRFPRLHRMTLQPEALSTLGGQLVLSAVPGATLNFLYNGLAIDARTLDGAGPVVRRWDGIVLHEIARDVDREHELGAQLRQYLPDTPGDAAAWLVFMMNGVPALRTRGWQVTVDPSFPYRLAVVDDWYADLQSPPSRARGWGSSREWFDLRLGVRVDGRAVNLLPALVAYLHGAARETGGQHDALSLVANGHLLVRMDDGRYLPVPLTRIERIADTLVELSDHEGLNERQALTLPSAQAGRVAQLALEADAPVRRSGTPALLSLIDAVAAFPGIEPLSAPTQFPVTLRPYQEEGLGWLQFLRRHGLGGILADDMGLGKTVQTLAHLVIEKRQGRLRKSSLIVAPVSLLGNWQQELRRFAPELSVLVLQGARRRERFASSGDADVILMGYPLLSIDSEMLLEREFCFVVLDEAQTIKNPQAKVSRVAQSLRAEHRLCLTGTPMENHLGELWSLVNFVQPGLLGERSEFQRLYRTPIENGGDARRAAALSRRVKPFLLRRTKDAVARDLPPKMQIVEAIELDEKQRDFYDSIRLGQHRRVREVIAAQGAGRSQLTVLNALLKLRQACCDPRLVDADAATQPVPSAKLDWLSTALPEMIAEGRRILLFSQFTSMLRLIEGKVNELGIRYCLLTGETSQRAVVVERFQAGGVPLFLISLKAGGTGLNLTAADTVIHYDPWWNPAVEAQATDRAHRIGQDKPVFVYKLIAQGTVEEKILQLQADKHALVTQLYAAGNTAPSQLTSADLDALFAP